MDVKDTVPLRWSVERRLGFIDLRLFWDGKINRSDLIERYSISVPQASADLSRYQEVAPDNTVYDKHMKSYVATSTFSPRFADPSARQYLAQLQLLADDVLDREQSWLGEIPEYAVVPRVRRRLDAGILRRFLAAIQHRSALRITYQSFTTPEPTERWIVPHALGFDGYRWHVRAWCEFRERFLDFVLARIIEFGGDKVGNVDATRDLAWHRYTKLRLGPHPRLSTAQRHVTARDFGMENDVVEVTIRRSLVYYFVRQLGLDAVHDDLEELERWPLILLNDKQVNDELLEVGEGPIRRPKQPHTIRRSA